ncbi:hypothetical protein EGI20_15755 [Aquitalea sp. S1-19]|nr:hypothetical protein [Aquitalea sp. S1-19]
MSTFWCYMIFCRFAIFSGAGKMAVFNSFMQYTTSWLKAWDVWMSKSAPAMRMRLSVFKLFFHLVWSDSTPQKSSNR